MTFARDYALARDLRTVSDPERLNTQVEWDKPK
jgi:hypothetical protein